MLFCFFDKYNKMHFISLFLVKFKAKILAILYINLQMGVFWN